MSIGGRIARVWIQAKGAARSAGKTKVFCVGKNKTGTSSMEAAFRELGYTIGDQRLAERLTQDYINGDFRRIFRYCMTAQAFQDVPFSWPGTFRAMDERFPRSKFVLTVRNNPEQWYCSLGQFLAKLFGDGEKATASDLRRSDYVYKGWALEAVTISLGTSVEDPLNKELSIAAYNRHNSEVCEHFNGRPDQLLVLNVAEPGAYHRLCEFLGKPGIDREFPWENRTRDTQRMR